MKWLTSGEICAELRISPTTLQNWKNSEKIRVRKFSNRKYLYDIDSINEIPTEINRINVAYSRVSNLKQQEDLQRQTSILKEFMVKNGVVPDLVLSDIASGMNENRNGLNQLISLVVQSKVDKIYVSYKDRLTRFGFGYFEHLFQLFGTTIVVINLTDEKDYQQELLDDFMAILHHFSMKMYSNRRKVLKEMKKQLEIKE